MAYKLTVLFSFTAGRCPYIEIPNSDFELTNATEGVTLHYGCIKGYRDNRYRRRVNITCDSTDLTWKGDFLICEGNSQNCMLCLDEEWCVSSLLANIVGEGGGGGGGRLTYAYVHIPNCIQN